MRLVRPAAVTIPERQIETSVVQANPAFPEE
jgi:hypothetical protein